MAKSRPLNIKNVNPKMEKIGYLRAAIVNAFHTDIARDSSRPKSEIVRSFLKTYNSGVLYPAIYLELGSISRSTLYSWDQAFREGGVDAMIPLYGSSHRPEITEDEKKVLLHLVFTQSRIQIGFTVRLAKFLIKEKGLESPSSAATMRRWLADFRRRSRKNAWLLLRNNEKALRFLLASSGEEDHEND